MKTANDDLEEMEYDKYIADQKALLDDIYSRYEQNINERIDQIDADLEIAIEALTAGTDSVIDSILSSTDNIGLDIGVVSGDIQNATDVFSTRLDGILASMTESSAGMQDLIGTSASGIQSSIGDFSSGMQSFIGDSTIGIQSSIDGSAGGIQSSIDGSASGIQSAIDGSTDGIQSVIDGSADGIQSAIDDATGVADNVDGKLSSTNDALQDILDTTNKILEEAEKAERETEVNKDSVNQNIPTTTPEASPMEPPKQEAVVPTPTEKQPAQEKEITIGGKINAGKAKIYDYAGDTSGANQYFADDPIYVVLDEQDGYLKVRHHKLSSGATGWFKKSDVKAYKTGGLVDYTGLAKLDGTPSKPELVLNAQDTENFLDLKDVLARLAQQDLMPKSLFDEYRNAPLPNHIGLFNDSQEIKRILDQHMTSGYQQTIGDINITIPIEHVQDYNEFVTQLKNDRKFERLVQDMTVNRLSNKSSLAKYNNNW